VATQDGNASKEFEEGLSKISGSTNLPPNAQKPCRCGMAFLPKNDANECRHSIG